MASMQERGIEDSTLSMGYDDYLGRFVDAVQHDSARYETLLEAWSADCPTGWRDQFATDTAEIATLIEAGAFGRAEDAA